jgi:uncharacterized Zn finger protein
MPWRDEDDSKETVARAIERRRSRGEPLVPVETGKGSKIAGNFWGIAWQHHLEGYADYESRLPKARTLLRQGKVFDLEISEGQATAMVAGQGLHDVIVRVRPLDPVLWSELKAACEGKVGSLLDLLSGSLGDDVMRVLADRERGVFPDRSEVKTICDCPDEASLCPHGAAVLYGIGLKFDSDPALFFRLRRVDQRELVSSAQRSIANGAPTGESAPEIAPTELESLFGIELSE